MTKTEIIKLFVAVIIFAVVIAVVAVLGRIDTAQTIQLIITFVLVLVTVAYVKRTAEIASETREQAKASVEMAEPVRQQTIMASRPFIIQRTEQKKAIKGTIVTEYYSHFEVYNAGNSPAIELEVFLLNEEKSLVYGDRGESYLR